MNGRRHSINSAGAATAGIELGGDGTLLGAAAIMLRTEAVAETALGVIPMGTANLLARDLDIPLEPEQAIDALIEGRRRRIRVLNDGEGLRLTTPLVYRSRPGALAVLVPQASPETWDAR